MSQTSSSRQIICSSCGGVFDENLPKCPYCETLNIEGAEKEYFEKLEDVREDLEKLTDVPVEEVKTTLKTQTKLIKKVVIATIIVALLLATLFYYMENRGKRDVKADYLWKQENYPRMTAWYEQEEYDTLLEFYWQAVDEDQPVWEWGHFDFCVLYDTIQRIQDTLEREKYGEKLELITLEYLFYDEWCVIAMPFLDDLTEEDFQKLEYYIEIADRDVRERFSLTEEEYNHFYEQVQEYGYPDSEECREFVNSKMKEEGVN